MRPNVLRAIVGGLVGTLALTIMMYLVAPMMGVKMVLLASRAVPVGGTSYPAASCASGFQVENAEHLHRVARHSELLADYTDVTVTQGFECFAKTGV
jgi:hypothetical protein